jgi:hypothetical protein
VTVKPTEAAPHKNTAFFVEKYRIRSISFPPARIRLYKIEPLEGFFLEVEGGLHGA